MSQLKIGTSEGKAFSIPLDNGTAATHTYGILGRRGSGKTHTAVVLVEELDKQGIQIVIVDPPLQGNGDR